MQDQFVCCGCRIECNISCGVALSSQRLGVELLQNRVQVGLLIKEASNVRSISLLVAAFIERFCLEFLYIQEQIKEAMRSEE